MPKKTTLKIHETNCLNCSYPFNGQENFCPECGQKNKGNELTFYNFMNELFSGFVSWDAKFWTTFIPLLTNPGKVSLDYVQGKRNRYTNPFRFYLTVSIIFFLIITISNTYDDLKELNKTSKSSSLNNNHLTKNILKDSINNTKIKQIKKEKNTNNYIKKNNKTSDFILPENKDITSVKIAGFNFGPLMAFQKKYPKIEIDIALDSLQLPKTFINRFMYKRAEAINGLRFKKNESQKLENEIISKTSIALFVLLPIFSLFLKLLYIRRKRTYVAHLVFTFHTQTVFFLFLTLVLLIGFIKNDTDTILGIFILLFLLYLFLAMKKFYQQGYIKTFIKFLLANIIFMFLSILGMTIVSAISILIF